MKFIHLSDLHIGKHVNGFSMIDDQKRILAQTIEVMQKETPQAVVIAGDVYDKSVPSADAVTLFDDFLTQIVELENHPQVFIISGNHDSAERLAFGNRLIDRSGVHISPVYDGKLKPVVLSDDHGEVAFYMLPFIKPLDVRNAYPEATIESHTDAVREALAHAELDQTRRNVLIAHQYATGAERSESEDVVVGGLDNVEASVFGGFDYVALGHLHRPQKVHNCEHIRYCGTLLKYSFSEIHDQKAVMVVELQEKGKLNCKTIPLTPLHDMREVKGNFDDLTLPQNYQGTATDDYMHVILTDENDVVDAIGQLRLIYPNIMKLDYDNQRTKNTVEQLGDLADVDKRPDIEVLEELYKQQNGMPLNAEQRDFAEKLFNAIKKEK